MKNGRLAKARNTIATLAFGLAIYGPLQAYAQNPADQAKQPDAADIERGKKLFQGTARFASGGPSCLSCHHVQNDTVAPGGTLAVELTAVFANSGAEGVRSMLPLEKTESPFPVMQAAYQNMRLTDAEANSLTAFLQQAAQQQASQKAGSFGTKMLLCGVAGVAAMLAFFALIGQRRKRKSVNQHIYDRQLKTE